MSTPSNDMEKSQPARSTPVQSDSRVRAMFVVPSLVRDGAERQVVNLANQLDVRRFEKHLFTFESPLSLLERVNGQEISHVHVPRRHKYDLAPPRALARLIDERNIDVVHCTLMFALLVGWLAVRMSSRRPALVVAVHTTIHRQKKDEVLDRLLYQWLMRQCASVIFVCDNQKRFWVRKFPFLSELAVTIHNGLGIAEFKVECAQEAGRALRRDLDIHDDATVVAHVAAFRPEKGHQLLLDALEDVVKAYPSLVVIFAGDGAVRAHVEQCARQKGLERHVRFLGSISDIRPVYGAADFSVLPSTAVETFSLAMLESLALEVPMIAADLGGAREAVLDGVTGLIVRPGDVPDLARAMKQLCADPAQRLRMGLAGRRVVCERYTEAAMVAGTARIIEQAAESVGAGGALCGGIE